MPTPDEIDRVLRPLPLKDLRLMARARGLNPAGGHEALADRIKQHMFQTGDFNAVAPSSDNALDGPAVVAPQGYQQFTPSGGGGAYSYQSNGAMAPPGGYSQVQLGGYSDYAGAQQQQQYGAPPQTGGGGGVASFGASSQDQRAGGYLSNNYSRPGGQNTGNFITDRPSSKVLAPPGGKCQISFGDYTPSYQQSSAQQAPSYGGPQPAAAGYSAPPQQQQSPYQQQQGGYPSGPPPGHGYSAGPPPGQGYPAGPPGGYGNSPGGANQGPIGNNYSRPGGAQNQGNFISDRPSSKVLAPPGGKSQISFG